MPEEIQLNIYKFVFESHCIEVVSEPLLGTAGNPICLDDDWEEKKDDQSAGESSRRRHRNTHKPSCSLRKVYFAGSDDILLVCKKITSIARDSSEISFQRNRSSAP